MKRKRKEAAFTKIEEGRILIVNAINSSNWFNFCHPFPNLTNPFPVPNLNTLFPTPCRTMRERESKQSILFYFRIVKHVHEIKLLDIILS